MRRLLRDIAEGRVLGFREFRKSEEIGRSGDIPAHSPIPPTGCDTVSSELVYDPFNARVGDSHPVRLPTVACRGSCRLHAGTRCMRRIVSYDLGGWIVSYDHEGWIVNRAHQRRQRSHLRPPLWR